MISVIMPVYKGEKYVAQAIQSILDQSETDIELIVIDDCGGDHSIEIASSINDGRIRIIRNAKNEGIAYSRNRGINEARGEYIAIMDDDDYSMPNRLKCEKEYLDTHRDVDGVGGAIAWMDREGHIVRYMSRMICNPLRIRAEMLFGNVIMNGTTMFRKEYVNKHNIRFKDNYLGMEDYKFWTDFTAEGNFVNIWELFLNWRMTESSETFKTRKNKREEREKLYSQIQLEALRNHGLFVKDIEGYTRCFREYYEAPIQESELRIALTILKDLLKQSEVNNCPFHRELEFACKDRYSDLVKKSTVWTP